MSEDEVARLIVKAFKEKELLKVGNRSYLNAFKYPESRFDPKDLMPNVGSPQALDPQLQPLTDPGKLFTDKYVTPPSSLIFQWGGRVYDKKWWGEIAGGLTDASTVIQSAVNALTSGGLIFIKSGLYYIKSGINIAVPVVIQGEGPEWYQERGTYLIGQAANIYIFNFDFPALDFVPIVRDIQFSNYSGVESASIRLGGNVSDAIIERVAAHGPGSGVLIDGGFNGFIRNCWLESGTYGIRIKSGGAGFIISQNHFYNSSEASISAEHWATSDLFILHNLCSKDRKNSFYLNLTSAHVIGNAITDAGQSASNTYDAIVTAIRGPLIIEGNKVSGANTRYGVNVVGDNANAKVSIQNNVFGVFASKAVNLVAGLMGVYKVKNNIGYVTENSGTATIAVGATYVDVPHGLAITPDANRIKVTPKDNLGGRSFWISDVTATTFRINISSADTVDHVFGWSYE